MKKYLVISLVSFLLSLAIAPLRGGYVSIGSLTGIPLGMLALLVLYFLLTFFYLKQKGNQLKPSGIVLAILIGSSILELPAAILLWGHGLIAVFDLPCRWIAIGVAYFYYRWSGFTLRRVLLLLLYSIFSIWIVFKGFDLWLHKYTFGTFTGETSAQVQTNEIVLTDSLGEPVSIHDLQGRYLVLDFWYTYCGVCFAKFPNVQKFYEKTRSDDKIALYSIHCRLEDREETYLTGREILIEEGYPFPVLSINMKDSVLKQLGVNKYPTILVFDSQRELVFRGNLESAERYLDKLDL